MSETDRPQQVVRQGFFPAVIGEDVRVERGGGMLFVAKQNLTISQGGGQWLIAGRDQTIEQGGGAILLSRQARVSKGFVGLLVAQRVTLEDGARALFAPTLPVAVAALAGFALGALAGRRRRSGRAPMLG